jgi:hypothetical protein
MQIYEEYLQRHDIGMSLVKYVSVGYLFLKKPTDIGFNWEIVRFNWKEKDRSPGRYYFNVYTPVHDGNLIEDNLVSPEIELNWDAYEDFLYDWTYQQKKSTVISGHKEMVLAAWEIFIFCHDTYFARNFDYIEPLLFESLNFNSSVETRFSSYQKTMKSVSGHYSFFKQWNSLLNIYSKNYCHWLVELIKKNGY